MLQLVTDSRFTWLLDTDVDTTTKNSNCAYDRCVCVCVCVCVWEGEGGCMCGWVERRVEWEGLRSCEGVDKKTF